ncbi:MAG: 2-hydroxychromene-2-carboxylate isomerase [Gammaproteobacteria bacterium]
MNKLSFYFDYISHNAYLAWVRLLPLCKKHDLTLEPIPVLFGALLEANGQLGPAEIRGKSLWMLRDVVRKSKQYGIPIAPPASHPFNPLLPLRASCTGMDAGQRIALVTAMFEAAWVRSLDLSDPEVVHDVIASTGLEADAVMAASGLDATKTKLRQQTEDALAVGVFGVPTMIARDRLFWGFDDLEFLDQFLAGKDPVADEDLASWMNVKPSIQRVRK